MGKPKVKFPEPSPEEKALQNQQIQLLREQRDILSKQMREAELLAPILYGAAGIEPIFDDKGDISGFRQIEDPLAAKRKDIESGFLDRTLAAQRGELPVDPALLRDLREQEQTLGEQLRRDLGPGFATSTPGQERLQRFDESRNILLEGARRGDLTLGEQLGMSREMANEQRTNQLMQRMFGLANRNQPVAGGLLANVGASNPIMANFYANREGQFGARALNFQYDAYANPFTWQGAYRNLQQDKSLMAGMISTARAKKDFRPLDKESGESLKKLRAMPMFRYRYTWEGPEREPHIGPVHELSPKEIKLDETRLSLGDYLGLTTAAVKDLDREVQAIKAVTRGASS